MNRPLIAALLVVLAVPCLAFGQAAPAKSQTAEQ